MTPSIERGHGGSSSKVNKGSHSINHERASQLVQKAGGTNNTTADKQYPGSSGVDYPPVQKSTKQVMVTDGGTGASLKRVFI